jgi:hypothetical protein
VRELPDLIDEHAMPAAGSPHQSPQPMGPNPTYTRPHADAAEVEGPPEHAIPADDEEILRMQKTHAGESPHTPASTPVTTPDNDPFMTPIGADEPAEAPKPAMNTDRQSQFRVDLSQQADFDPVPVADVE